MLTHVSHKLFVCVSLEHWEPDTEVWREAYSCSDTGNALKNIVTERKSVLLQLWLGTPLHIVSTFYWIISSDNILVGEYF